MKKVFGLIGGIALVLAYIGGFALHAFACYIAYGFSFGATVLTFGLPGFSEIYWFFALWVKIGFWNLYTIAFLAVAALFAIGFGGSALSVDKLDQD